METLVVVAQHRNQYCSRVVKPNGYAKLGSSPSRHFRDINCRTFQSGAGLLPTPFPPSTDTVTKRNHSSSSACYSPKTPSPTFKSHFNYHSVDNTCLKSASKSSPIAINLGVSRKETTFDEELGFINENLPFSERWAGPAYSNSPPPSSLPIPKFSMRPPKRTVSLDLPVSDEPDIQVQPTAKSAPASPTREHSPSMIDMRDFFHSADSATKTLRRILNLDVAEE